MPECIESAALAAETTVRASVAQARQWFLELQEHPERYRFETHAGFAFIEGDFGDVGAQFETWETFYGVKLTLRFELTEIGDRRFRFRLLRPALPIWGAFVIEEAGDSGARLCIGIGGTTRLGEWVLHIPLLKGAVRWQIHGEVEHIRASMEALYARA
jgi:hypothetical protein